MNQEILEEMQTAIRRLQNLMTLLDAMETLNMKFPEFMTSFKAELEAECKKLIKLTNEL